MMSMSRTLRYAVGLAVVLSISAPVVAQAQPDHLRWKGQVVGGGQVSANQAVPVPHHPKPMSITHRDAFVFGSSVHQPATVVRVVHSGGGNGFDWTAAFVGAASAAGIVLVAGAMGMRSRRVAIS